jgi:hypothetical protein
LRPNIAFIFADDLGVGEQNDLAGNAEKTAELQKLF